MHAKKVLSHDSYVLPLNHLFCEAINSAAIQLNKHEIKEKNCFYIEYYPAIDYFKNQKH